VPVTVIGAGQAFRHHSDLRPWHDVTTHGDRFRLLSPMLLGPVPLYAGMTSRNMENAWQYAKVYPAYRQPAAYWPWAQAGWASIRAERYPAGKGARPLHTLWAGDELGYITARRRVYVPLYAQAVRMHQLPLFLTLRMQAQQQDLVLVDFDAYDHRALGYSWADVMNDPERKMGHGFVLAMMIEGVL
jgi:hypothetical protein